MAANEDRGETVPFCLKGRVALVTGAGGGIGSAICQCLAEAGASVALADLHESVIGQAERLGPAHRGFACDVRSEEAIVAQVEAIAQHFGAIDILVNNAGMGKSYPAEEQPAADFDLTIAINLRAPMIYAREAARHMLSRGYGRVINIASQAAVIGLDGHVAYSASKAGLVGMTNVMAVEWGPRGVTANCISPTVVDTQAGRAYWSGERGERARSEIPTRRFAQPDEIALATLYIASEAAGMVNGANLMIDGGNTIR